MGTIDWKAMMIRLSVSGRLSANDLSLVVINIDYLKSGVTNAVKWYRYFVSREFI